jgi:hypothetical protein
MAYALTSKNYFGNLFQWRNACRIARQWLVAVAEGAYELAAGQVGFR